MLWLRHWQHDRNCRHWYIRTDIYTSIFVVNTQWGGVIVCCYALSWIWFRVYFSSRVAFNILFYKYVVFVNICRNCLGWKLRLLSYLRPSVPLSVVCWYLELKNGLKHKQIFVLISCLYGRCHPSRWQLNTAYWRHHGMLRIGLLLLQKISVVCVALFGKVTVRLTDRLFRVVISVVTFIVKMNLCLPEERVHWVCDTRTYTETTFLILRAGINAFLAGIGKGWSTEVIPRCRQIRRAFETSE